MPKKYLDVNVYDAANERVKIIFDSFERIYLSYSGGKDSNVMLNIVLNYMKKHNIKRKIGLQVLDNECNYKQTLDNMFDVLDENRDYLDIYWNCLPITLPCTTSSFQADWQCWGEKDKDIWVREYPNRDYVVTIHNHKYPFYKENMTYDKFWDCFGEWYSQGKPCASLIGIRTEESLNRFRAIVTEKKEKYKNYIWTVKKSDKVYNCYPIFDWTTEDIWIGNAKFGWKYNKLYDMFHLAGLTIHQMRVASPFMSESKSSLYMYRAIDPDAWSRLCMRVNGANYIATYSKQLKYHDFKKPNNHTWESFVRFLLETMPPEASENYRNMILKSINYWKEKGRGLDEKTTEILRNDKHVKGLNGKTSHGRKNKERVVFDSIPDDMDYLPANNSSVISWKRFAIMILKNDHTGKYIGYVSPFDNNKRKRELIEKYRSLL